MKTKKFLILEDFLKNDHNVKISELENKIPIIRGLALSNWIESALNPIENKVPNFSSLVKKTDYDIKVGEAEKKLTDHSHNKYVTTSEFNTFTEEIFAAKLTQANLITKADFGHKLIRKITKK